MNKTKYLYLFIIIALFGCVSQIVSLEKYAKGWIGSPVSELQDVIMRPPSYALNIGWKEKKYNLDNGNWVYVTPARRDCFIHWEVNRQGIIINYKTEGSRCY